MAFAKVELDRGAGPYAAGGTISGKIYMSPPILAKSKTHML
jgi:hypothetical protein